jgi:hypothetical protein
VGETVFVLLLKKAWLQILVVLPLISLVNTTTSTTTTTTMTARLNDVPQYTGKVNIVSDIRKFRDYCAAEWWPIISGNVPRPVPFTPAEEAAMGVHERTGRVIDMNSQIRKYDDKNGLAFAAILKFIEKETTLYSSAEMDVFRDQLPLDPAATWIHVRNYLMPQSVDAQILVETQINHLKFQPGEKLSELMSRMNGLVARLPAAERPTDLLKIKTITRAIKGDVKMRDRYRFVLDSLVSVVPAHTYITFCRDLTQIEMNDELEADTMAALATDSTSSDSHRANEVANAAEHGRGRGRGGRGRGNKRKFQDGQDYARGQAQEQSDYRDHRQFGGDDRGPHWRGGNRRDGGRGGRGEFGGRGRGRGRGDFGRGRGGGDHYQFQGACHRCGNQGHKQIDCSARRHAVTGAALN